MTPIGFDSSIPNDPDSSLGDINKHVERWNHRAKERRTIDRENYINGDIKFLFDYSGIRNFRGPTLPTIHGRDFPNYVPVVLAEAAIDKPSGEIWNLLDKHLRRKPCEVSCWDQKLVLIDDIKLVNEKEKFIPPRLTMGFQVEKGLIEGWRDPIGESRFHGFVKPCLGFAEGKLQSSPFLVRCGDRIHDFPICVIESGAEVVNNISTNNSGPVYDGLVSFCEGGALSSPCICFENVGERALFPE